VLTEIYLCSVCEYLVQKYKDATDAGRAPAGAGGRAAYASGLPRGRSGAGVVPPAPLASAATAPQGLGLVLREEGGGGGGGGRQRWRRHCRGESFPHVYWVAVPEVLRARHVNRRRRRQGAVAAPLPR
jgi:hypothetical protein